MLISTDMNNARQNILRSGIQQTNRYRFFFSPMNVFLYPYEIILPGLGYESIEHSIWSIIRKIPFRKSFTDLQVKFIIGNDNYSHFINLWDSLIPKPSNSFGYMSDADAISLLLNSGASPTVEGEDTSSAVEDQQTVSFSEIQDNFLSTRTPQNIGYARGGAPQYDDYIKSSFVIVSLLKEDKLQINTTLIFEEAYITQIQPTQLTSVETGYSTFTVNFKFASLRAE